MAGGGRKRCVTVDIRIGWRVLRLQTDWIIGVRSNMADHIIVIGAGPAGYAAALEASDLGARVTLVGAHDIGGTCLWRGCIPTKSLIASSKVLSQARRAEEYGLILEGSIRPDWDALRARMDRVVNTNVRGIGELLRNRNVELVEGHGRLIDGEGGQIRVEVDKQQMDPGNVILCSGSCPTMPAVFPVDGERIGCSDDVLGWGSLPRSVTIVGGGVIASEFAFMLAALDVEVTVVEMADRPLPAEDKEVSKVIAREMKKRRIGFLARMAVDEVRCDDHGVSLHGSGKEVMHAERVVVAVGRTPVTAGMGLEDLGLVTGSRGEVTVDEFMRTNVAGLYAAGDVTGQCMLAHAASAQARVAVGHMLGKGHKTYVNEHIPRVTFTDPEVASVGLTEQEARERYGDIRVGHFDLRALGKAHALGELSGFVKLIAGTTSDRVLGAHIVSPYAGALIQEPATLLANGCDMDMMVKAVHAHPTLAEALQEAAEDTLGQALHKRRT